MLQDQAEMAEKAFQPAQLEDCEVGCFFLHFTPLCVF